MVASAESTGAAELLARTGDGVLLYGLTPPRGTTTPERADAVAEVALARLRPVQVDGIVLYDVDAEAGRSSTPRPFPFMPMMDPAVFLDRHLGGWTGPVVVYRAVGKYTGDELGQWLSQADRDRVLMDMFTELTEAHRLDIAFVLRDERDYAAVQSARKDPPAEAWAPPGSEQIAVADFLAGKAARKELSLFVGSGVSKPLGVPDWAGLLTAMAGRAGVRPPSEEEIRSRPDEVAAELRASLGSQVYRDFLSETFPVGRHAIGHALLAGLRVRQTVTTNYDPCLERAMHGVLGPDGYQVMTRHLARGGYSWLLKLHGNVERPDSIVLTSEDYTDLSTQSGALHGVVEAMLLTSHVLFVGFGLNDPDFNDLANGVIAVRNLADGPLDDRYVGTTISLFPWTRHDEWRGFIRRESVGVAPDTAVAARNLEIFLDRLAWRSVQGSELAAGYLLDPNYAMVASAEDTALREGLLAMLTDLPPQARRSSGWPKVQQMFGSLGHRV